MMNNASRLWLLLSLALLCAGGLLTSCDDSDDAGPGYDHSKTVVAKEYKDYLSDGGLKSDVQQLTELAAHERLIELLFIKMESGDWTEPLFTTTDYSDATMRRYFEVLGEAVENADKYEAAIKRLSQSQALGTSSPETRGFDNIPFYTAVKLTGYLKMSGKACRAAIVGVIVNSGHAEDVAWLKERCNYIDQAHMRGCKDHVDFWQKFSRGELDDRACTIFGNLMSSDAEFVDEAAELGVTRGGTIRSIAVPMITAGVNIVLNLTPMGTYAAETMEIGGNLSNLVDSVKAGGAVGGTLVKTVSSIAKTGYNHFGKAPVDGGNAFYGDIIENAQKELILGGAGDAEDGIATTLDNLILGSGKAESNDETELLKNRKQAKVEYTDTDKRTPAQVVVATDKNGNVLSIGTPDADGKTTVIVPAGTEVAITAVDSNGDKHTETANVKTGETKSIEAATNENELIEAAPEKEKPSISCATEKLEFDADGGKQTFNVAYKSLFIAAVVLEDEAEDWCSVDVDNKGKVTVACKPNDGSERTCTVAVGAWNDEEAADMEIVEIEVVQSGVTGDLSFIDWNKFCIQQLIVLKVEKRFYCDYALEQSFKFPNKSLTINKVSDSEYEVTGIISDEGIAAGTSIPEHSIRPDSPYGIHYEVTFRVVAKEGDKWIPACNFCLKDVRINGYSKWTESQDNHQFSDRIQDFQYYFKEVDLRDEGYLDSQSKPKGSCYLDFMMTDDRYAEVTMNESYWDYTWDSGSKTGNWEYKEETEKHATDSFENSSFEMIIRWDSKSF